MYSYSLGYKEDDDLMFDMEEDEMGRKGSGYKSSECLCCNNSNSNQTQLPGDGPGLAVAAFRDLDQLTAGLRTGPQTQTVPGTLKISSGGSGGGLVDTGQSGGDTDIIAEADIYRGHYYWRHRGLSSVSSVEEAVEDILDSEAGDKSDLKPDSEAVSAEPKSKSPKYLPKFLRASFSRLISKEKSSKSGSLTGQDPISLPFFSSVSIPSLASPTPSLSQTTDSDKETEAGEGAVIRPCSPTTQQFVQDSLARGFPLIPFHYTSLDIVERGRARHRNKIQDPVPPELEVSLSSPARAKYRRLHSEHEDPRLDLEGDIAQRSLESVLSLAQQELEMEENKKKICDHSRMMSRASERRRSSASDYVGLAEDVTCLGVSLDLDTEEEMILSTVARARSARSLKHKISKSCDAAQS